MSRSPNKVICDKARRIRGLFRRVEAPGLPRVLGLVALAVLRCPGLVPYRLRWQTASLGLGLIVARACEEQRSTEDRLSMQTVLHELGREQGRALRQGLEYGRNPAECARAVALANRLFNIDARVVVDAPERARVVTPGCPWSREEWWGRRPCGAFSRYEHGLVEGLNPHVAHRYESKVVRGDSICVGVYTWKETPASSR